MEFHLVIEKEIWVLYLYKITLKNLMLRYDQTR